ncbi:MAG TPA: alpha/beta hydrolase [Pseudonocardiaceae bacterium]
MHRATRLVVLCTTAAISVALALVGTTPASAASGADNQVTTGGFRPAAIDWQPCPERPNDATIRCATIKVPIDWSDPTGPTFGLAIDRQAAADPAADDGPLLINPGGPGGSGVDFALDAAGFFNPQILRHFDIIGFDPRGTNRSDPVQCSTSLLEQRPFPVPSNPADYAALLAYNTKLDADCKANTGAIFDHVDTASVDRDMDAIRAALGVPKISYYGVSYGTLIGQEYAELFPDRIRAMVIDSNMDHSLSTTGFLLTEAATDEDSFDQFEAWCDRDSTCALHGQDVHAIWTELQRRADAGTLKDPTTGQALTWLDLTSAAVNALYGPDWSQLGAAMNQLYTGKAGGVALPHRPAATAPLSQFPLPVFCEDWSLPESGYAHFQQDFALTNLVAPQLRTSSLGWSVFASCLGWTGPVNDPQQRLDVHADVPLLELNSVHDPATPYTWALDDAAQLGSAARLVTYLGWGHGAYPHSSCTQGTVDDYLINGTLPAPGATCAAVPPPDTTSQTRLVPTSPPGGIGW